MEIQVGIKGTKVKGTIYTHTHSTFVTQLKPPFASLRYQLLPDLAYLLNTIQAKCKDLYRCSLNLYLTNWRDNPHSPSSALI